MGGDPAGGAALGDRSNYPQDPAGGATLGSHSNYPAQPAKSAKDTSNQEPAIKRPSEVTGDPYDDHPGTVYACEGPVSRAQSGAIGAGAGIVTGTFLSESGGSEPVPAGATLSEQLQAGKRARSDTEKQGVTTIGGAAGFAIGQTKWFNCYINNGYNFIVHPGATQTIDQEGDWGGAERD